MELYLSQGWDRKGNVRALYGMHKDELTIIFTKSGKVKRYFIIDALLLSALFLRGHFVLRAITLFL